MAKDFPPPPRASVGFEPGGPEARGRPSRVGSGLGIGQNATRGKQTARYSVLTHSHFLVFAPERPLPANPTLNCWQPRLAAQRSALLCPALPWTALLVARCPATVDRSCALLLPDWLVSTWSPSQAGTRRRPERAQRWNLDLNPGTDAPGTTDDDAPTWSDEAWAWLARCGYGKRTPNGLVRGLGRRVTAKRKRRVLPTGADHWSTSRWGADPSTGSASSAPAAELQGQWQLLAGRRCDWPARHRSPHGINGGWIGSHGAHAAWHRSSVERRSGRREGSRSIFAPRWLFGARDAGAVWAG